MKQANTQVASSRSLTPDKAVVSEAALADWIRPGAKELTFDQLIDRIALSTSLDLRSPPRRLWHGQQHNAGA